MRKLYLKKKHLAANGRVPWCLKIMLSGLAKQIQEHMQRLKCQWGKQPDIGIRCLSLINLWSFLNNVSHISILEGMFTLKASCCGFTNTGCTQVGCEALICKVTTSLYVPSTFPLNGFLTHVCTMISWSFWVWFMFIDVWCFEVLGLPLED